MSVLFRSPRLTAFPALLAGSPREPRARRDGGDMARRASVVRVYGKVKGAFTRSRVRGPSLPYEVRTERVFTNIVVYNLIKCAVFTSIVSKFEVCVDNQFTHAETPRCC